MSESNDSSVETTGEVSEESGGEETMEISPEEIESAYETIEAPSQEAKEVEEILGSEQKEALASYDTLSDKERVALERPSEDRTWRQTELADAARHGEYDTQRSFIRGQDGKVVEASHGEKDSQRPDGIRIDPSGRIDIREVKDYHNADSLMRNMAEQTADRKELFGKDAEVTFAVAANDFTVEDAERIQDYAENTLHVNIEWLNK